MAPTDAVHTQENKKAKSILCVFFTLKIFHSDGIMHETQLFPADHLVS